MSDLYGIQVKASTFVGMVTREYYNRGDAIRAAIAEVGTAADRWDIGYLNGALDFWDGEGQLITRNPLTGLVVNIWKLPTTP